MNGGRSSKSARENIITKLFDMAKKPLKLTKSNLVATAKEIHVKISAIEPPIDESLKLADYGKELYNVINDFSIDAEEIKQLSEESQATIEMLLKKDAPEPEKVSDEKAEQLEKEEVDAEATEEVDAEAAEELVEGEKTEAVGAVEDEPAYEVEGQTKEPSKRSRMYPKRQAMYDALKASKKGLTLDKWAEKMNALYVKNGGSDNLQGTIVYIQFVSPVLVAFGSIEKNGTGAKSTFKLV